MRLLSIFLAAGAATVLAGCASRGVARSAYTVRSEMPPPRVISRRSVPAPVAAVRAPIVEAPAPAPIIRSTASRTEAPPPPAPLSLELLRTGRAEASAASRGNVRRYEAPPVVAAPHAPTRATVPCDVSALFECAPQPACPPPTPVYDPCCPGGNCDIPR